MGIGSVEGEQGACLGRESRNDDWSVFGFGEDESLIQRDDIRHDFEHRLDNCGPRRGRAGAELGQIAQCFLHAVP